jgi:hypothetical protein
MATNYLPPPYMPKSRQFPESHNRINLYVKRALKRIGIPTIDDQAFASALQEAITELEENFGKDHLNYPAAKWLAWAQVNQYQDLKQAFVVA